MRTRYFAILGAILLSWGFYLMINCTLINPLPIVFKLSFIVQILVLICGGLFCIAPVIDRGQFNKDGWMKTDGVRK